MLILYLLSRPGPKATPMEMAISVVIGWLVFGGWLWYQLTDPRNRQKPVSTEQNRPQKPPCPPATTQRTVRKLVVSRAAKRRK